MRIVLAMGALLLLGSIAAAPEDAVIAEARAADERLAGLIAAGDLTAAGTMIAHDYAYLDLGGSRIGKAKLFERRAGDKLRPISSTDSEGEAILLAPTVVLLRGRTDGLGAYFGGLPRRAVTRWSAIWRKESDGQWRVVAEQTTEVAPKTFGVKARVDVAPATVARWAGTYRLATTPPLDLRLVAVPGGLSAAIAGQFEAMPFLAEGPAAFFTVDRPFELRFADDARSLVLTTWGEPTAGTRLP